MSHSAFYMYVTIVYYVAKPFRLICVLFILGQGVKRCPYTKLDDLKQPHVNATHEKLRQRLQDEKHVRLSTSSPRQMLFNQTFAYYTALKEQGCPGPPYETTQYTEREASARDRHLQSQEKRQRGHPPPNTKCSGRLYFTYDRMGHAFVR